MRPEAYLKGLGMRWMVVSAMVFGTLGLPGPRLEAPPGQD